MMKRLLKQHSFSKISAFERKEKKHFRYFKSLTERAIIKQKTFECKI